MQALPEILAAGDSDGLEFVTISELAAEIRPQRRMALRAVLGGGRMAGGVFLLSTKLDLKAIAGVITDANPGAGARGGGGEPDLGGGQGADLEGGHRRGSQPRRRRPRARSLLEVVPAIFIGFLLNTVLFARLGEVARISVLRRKLAVRGIEVPVPTLLGTLVTEQLLSGVTLIAVLLGVAAFVSSRAGRPSCCWCWSGVVLVIAVAAASIELFARYRRSGRCRPRQDPVEHWWHLLGISLTAFSLAAAPGPGDLLRRSCWRGVCDLDRLLAGADARHPLGARGLRHRRGSGRGRRWCSWPRTWSACSRSSPATWWCSRARPTPRCRPTTSPTNLAINFSIGLQLIEALLGVGLGFFFLSYEGLSVGELRSEAEASGRVSSPS